jgi:predicted ATPase/DNA-binding CsgD family transcriptional regulator
MSSSNNLPGQRTSFIGRKREIADVKRLLSTTLLLTLTGSGGCGKTRLALQVAARVQRESPDGVWFVDLAPLVDPALVPQAVASALGVGEQPGNSLTDTLTAHLQPLTLLLVLDNCEHLLEACAQLANALLAACSGLRILATSRQVLGMYGEINYRVPSLSLPDPHQEVPPKTLATYEAIQLFVDRATPKRPGFAITPDNAHAVARVCRQLDGIPLAIELAAARANVLTVEEIAERLDNRFRLLTSGDRAAPPRQQTLRAMMDWSYDLRTEGEQSLMRGLSVFAGGFTLGAIEAVWESRLNEYELLDLLSGLADKSLVVMEERDGKSRYRLLETVRQYVWGKSQALGELPKLRAQHLEWCMALAEEAEPRLTGAGQTEWLARLEEDHDNMRAALRWGVETREVEMGLRLAGALLLFWYLRGYFSEGREHLAAALSGGQQGQEEAARAKALNGAGMLARGQGDYAAARSLFEESLTIRRDLEDKRGIATSLNSLGLVAQKQGDSAAARSLYEESLAFRRELGDKEGISGSLGNLGGVCSDQGDYAAARSLYEESLALRRELGDKGGIALLLGSLGRVAHEQGDYAAARSLYEESLAIRWELGHKYGIAECLEGLASMAGSQGATEHAARLFGASEALREAIGAPMPPVVLADYDRDVAAARAQLNMEAFVAAWNEGRAMTLEQAIAFALQPVPEPEPTTEAVSTPLYPNELTRREAELLRLLATGQSNKEIANQLCLSIHTVEAHLHSIYGKLEVTTRGAASRFATEHNLS